MLIASDTRLTDGGYGINSRGYLSGRIWSASSSPILQSTQARSTPFGLDSSSWNIGPAVWEPDGSLAMPHRNHLRSSPSSSHSPHEHEVRAIRSPVNPSKTPFDVRMPVLIGSAGCASDCESLKRRVRLEIDALHCNFPSASSLGVHSIANLLQQVLYSRRGFPFYSFCVVAGIDNRDCSGEGAVYVYDAIGSFERVAVGCSGTGRELLQPILDRLFSESPRKMNGDQKERTRMEGNGDIMSIPASEQRFGVAGSLRPPVRTTVNCTWEEAVKNVARGFQAVAEREISVGDELVICLLRSGDGGNNGSTVDVINFKLKKH